MLFLYISGLIVFCTVLCMVEVPKMVSDKSYKDLSAFSVILLLDIVIAVMKSFHMPVPNPYDWVMWFYSPFTKIMEEFFK